MFRVLLVLCVLFVGMLGVFVYTSLARDREFQQRVAEGDTAIRDGQTFLAIEAYSGALALDPDSMVAYLKRGETYHRHGDLPAALRDLSMAAQRDPGATRPHERLGDVTYELERYDDAVAHYASYVVLDDQNASVLYKLALANERAGHVAHSIPLLRRAITLEPQLSEAHYLLGLCLTEQERLEDARDALRVAIELSPGFLHAREALVSVSQGLGDHRGELQQLDALVALDQDQPERHVARGLAYARLGQADLGVLALGRAAEEHPGHPRIYAALGRIWLDIAESRGDHVALGKALEALRAVPTASATSEGLTSLGRALALDGESEGARRVLRLATERFPVEPTAFLYLANLEQSGDNPGHAQRSRRRYRALTADIQPAGLTRSPVVPNG